MVDIIFDSLNEACYLSKLLTPNIHGSSKSKNFKMFESARHGHVRYNFNNKEYTWFTRGWEDSFDKSNTYEKTIYLLQWYFNIFFKNPIAEFILFHLNYLLKTLKITF